VVNACKEVEKSNEIFLFYFATYQLNNTRIENNFSRLLPEKQTKFAFCTRKLSKYYLWIMKNFFLLSVLASLFVLSGCTATLTTLYGMKKIKPMSK
jgi:hypothetical protein